VFKPSICDAHNYLCRAVFANQRKTHVSYGVITTNCASQQQRIQNHDKIITAVPHAAIGMAGAGGIEPPHGGIKIRCLTAWLRPNARVPCSCIPADSQACPGGPRLEPIELCRTYTQRLGEKTARERPRKCLKQR
jgi:hypothetical protein